MAAVAFNLPFAVAAKPTGVGAPGAKAYFYAPGTTTLRTVYSNSGLTVARSNPVIADGAGQFPSIYLNNALTYKLVITDRFGSVLFSRDPYIPGEAPDASSLSPYADAAEASALEAAAQVQVGLASVQNAAEMADLAAAYAESALSAGSTYNTKAAAAAALGSVAADAYVLVLADESNSNRRVIYQKSGGVLVQRATLSSGSDSWFNARDYGVTGDGVTDDTAAIQAVIALAAATGGRKVIYFPTPDSGKFYKCASSLDLSLTDGVKLLGDGGRVEPNQDRIPCALVYTGTAGYFINAGKSRGLTFDGLAIQCSNASFTGDLVTLDHDGSVRVTYSTSFVNCMFGGRTSAARFARSCINMRGAVEAFVDLCTFGWANHHILGFDNTGSRTYSNAVTITRNRFANPNEHSINIYAAAQWTIANNVFEPRYDMAAGAISDLWLGGGGNHSSRGVIIKDNGFWDATGGIWISIYAQGQTISGNWSQNDNGVTFLQFGGGSTPTTLSGNYGGGTAGGIFLTGSASNVVDDGSNVLEGGVVNDLTGITFLPLGFRKGGSTSQLTNKATAVAVNHATGQITMNSASLAANTAVSFRLDNTQIAAHDDVHVWIKSGAADPMTYYVAAHGNAAGNRMIGVRNLTGGALAETLVLGFSVLRGAIT